jgi:hypothetical protein
MPRIENKVRLFNLQLRFENAHFRISSFDFPFSNSNFDFPISIFLFSNFSLPSSFPPPQAGRVGGVMGWPFGFGMGGP